MSISAKSEPSKGFRPRPPFSFLFEKMSSSLEVWFQITWFLRWIWAASLLKLVLICTMQELFEGVPLNWALEVPATASSSHTMFRWRQCFALLSLEHHFPAPLLFRWCRTPPWHLWEAKLETATLLIGISRASSSASLKWHSPIQVTINHLKNCSCIAPGTPSVCIWYHYNSWLELGSITWAFNSEFLLPFS